MAKRRKRDATKRSQQKKREKRDLGFQAKVGKKTLRSYEVGAMPIINHIIRRMRLPDILKEFLPDDSRSKLSAYQTVLVLVRNLLIAREPIYGLGQWASGPRDSLPICWTYVQMKSNGSTTIGPDARLSGCLTRWQVR